MRTCTQILRLSNHLWPTQWRGPAAGAGAEGGLVELAGSRLVLEQWARRRPCSRVTDRADRSSRSPNGWTRRALPGSSIRGGAPVINFLGAPPNHSGLHKFGRPGSAWRAAILSVSKGERDMAPLMSEESRLVPCQRPRRPAFTNRRLATAAGQHLAKPQDSRQNPVLFHLGRQSLSTHRQPISMTSSPASCSPLPLGPVPSLPPSRPYLPCYSWR